MRLALAQTLEAAGREVEALKSYREVAIDNKASAAHRRIAKQAADALQSENRE